MPKIGYLWIVVQVHRESGTEFLLDLKIKLIKIQIIEPKCRCSFFVLLCVAKLDVSLLSYTFITVS